MAEYAGKMKMPDGSEVRVFRLDDGMLQFVCKSVRIEESTIIADQRLHEAEQEFNNASSLYDQVRRSYGPDHQNTICQRERMDEAYLRFNRLRSVHDRAAGVRYCPECGTIGEIDKGKHANCCPDGNRAVYVPQAVASQARAGFHAGIYWLVWSNEHSAYWRPNSRGYTRLIDEAGVYSFEDAFKICRLNDPRAMSALSGDVPPEVMVPAPKLIDAIRAEKP